MRSTYTTINELVDSFIVRQLHDKTQQDRYEFLSCIVCPCKENHHHKITKSFTTEHKFEIL